METKTFMAEIASTLDDLLNGDRRGEDRELGFVLLVFPFNREGTGVNYVSNADRSSVRMCMQEMLTHWEDIVPQPGEHDTIN